MTSQSSHPLVAIVDDDEDVRMSLKSLAESLDIAAMVHESADAFLASEWRGVADCIISDVQMPGTDGFGLSRQVGASDHPVPVILISAYVTGDTVNRAARAGAVRFLPKPIAVDDLIALLEDLLQS